MSFRPTGTSFDRETLRLALISSINQALNDVQPLPFTNIPALAAMENQDIINTISNIRLAQELCENRTNFAEASLFAKAANPTGSNVFNSSLNTFLLQEMIKRENEQNKIRNSAMIDLLLKNHKQSQTAEISSLISPVPSLLLRSTLSTTNQPKSLEQVNPPNNVTQTLITLGSNLRQRSEPYIDCLALNLSHDFLLTPMTRGGVADPFPQKIFRMLQDTEREGLQHIVSFLSHGRAFAVFNIDLFVAQIMPRYFQQTKWFSFTRQLHLWGFTRIQSGPDTGGFYHELFLKGRPGLHHYMRRVGIPTANTDRRKFRKKRQDSAPDPDFYAMTPAL